MCPACGGVSPPALSSDVRCAGHGLPNAHRYYVGGEAVARARYPLLGDICAKWSESDASDEDAFRGWAADVRRLYPGSADRLIARAAEILRAEKDRRRS